MTTNYCIVLFVLSMLILLIVGFTCPPTMHFKFITKCGKCCYKLRQLVYNKVRQVVLQCATIFFIKKGATEHGSQRCCNINCILNICRQYFSS